MAEFSTVSAQVAKNALMAGSLSEGIGDDRGLGGAQPANPDSASQPATVAFSNQCVVDGFVIMPHLPSFNNVIYDTNFDGQVQDEDGYPETTTINSGDFLVNGGNLACGTSLLKNTKLENIVGISVLAGAESVAPLQILSAEIPQYRLGKADLPFGVVALGVQHPKYPKLGAIAVGPQLSQVTVGFTGSASVYGQVDMLNDDETDDDGTDLAIRMNGVVDPLNVDTQLAFSPVLAAQLSLTEGINILSRKKLPFDALLGVIYQGAVSGTGTTDFTLYGGVGVNAEGEEVAQINFSHACDDEDGVCPGIPVSEEFSQTVKPRTLDVGLSVIVPIKDQGSSVGAHLAATRYYYGSDGMMLGSTIPGVAFQEKPMDGVVVDVSFGNAASIPLKNTTDWRLGMNYKTPLFNVKKTELQAQVAAAVGRNQSPIDPIAAGENRLNILDSNSTVISGGLGVSLQTPAMRAPITLSSLAQYGMYDTVTYGTPEVLRNADGSPVYQAGDYYAADGYKMNGSYNNFGFAVTVPFGQGGLFKEPQPAVDE